MLLLGMSAGLPLLLVLGTLSFRLREAGIDRATISFLGWVGLAYGFKWVWAPLVDRMPIPLLTRMLGRRRSWLLVSQLVVMLGLVGMALSNPQEGVSTLARWALLVAFASATQDIALDAFRIESATVDRQAVLAANYQTGYRIAMIAAGAGVQVHEVNRLLKEFEQMQDMMKKMKGSGFMKMMKRLGSIKGLSGLGGGFPGMPRL